jgi:hypothetical protein
LTVSQLLRWKPVMAMQAKYRQVFFALGRPGVLLKAIKWLMMKHSPLAIQPTLDLNTWRWVMQMLMNCTNARYEVNKGRMLRMAEYSRDVLQQLRADTGISYDERTQGTLQLFRIRRSLMVRSRHRHSETL